MATKDLFLFGYWLFSLLLGAYDLGKAADSERRIVIELAYTWAYLLRDGPAAPAF